MCRYHLCIAVATTFLCLFGERVFTVPSVACLGVVLDYALLVSFHLIISLLYSIFLKLPIWVYIYWSELLILSLVYFFNFLKVSSAFIATSGYFNLDIACLLLLFFFADFLYPRSITISVSSLSTALWVFFKGDTFFLYWDSHRNYFWWK